MASSSRIKSRGYGVCYIHERSPSTVSSPSPSFASSTSSFTSRSSTFFARAVSPPRVSVYGHPNQSSPSVRFTIGCPTSPGRSISVIKQGCSGNRPLPNHKKTCMCSPTTHPGSFRCSLHKNSSCSPRSGGRPSVSYSSGRSVNFRRSAMTNSLVRICGVEGDLVKRALSALIRPSSHQLRRREGFQPRPTRLSIMSKA